MEVVPIKNERQSRKKERGISQKTEKGGQVRLITKNEKKIIIEKFRANFIGIGKTRISGTGTR